MIWTTRHKKMCTLACSRRLALAEAGMRGRHWYAQAAENATGSESIERY